MIKFLLAILIFTFSTYDYAQDIIISGLVLDNNNQYLVGAGIYENGNVVATSDINGYFSYKTIFSKKITITIKYVGYEPFTKSISLTKNKNKYEFRFKLKESTFYLENLVIKESAISAFKKNNWIIKDFIFVDSSIIVLYRDFKDTFLSIFELSGKLNSKTKLSLPFNSLYRSCLGGLHLIGKKYCREFEIEDEELYLKQIYNRERFDKLVKPCCLKFNNILIFKDYFDSNQKLVYFYYKKQNEKQKATKIYTVFDTIAASSAKIGYNRIIQEYYKRINRPSASDISYDFQKENIISEGIWDGDLMQLAIDDSLFVMISNYLSIETRPIKTTLVSLNDSLYIFDFANNKIINFNLNGTVNKEVVLHNLKCNNSKIINDEENNTLYLICNNKNIYEISPQTSEILLKKIIPSNYLFPKNISIKNEILYFITYDYSKFSYNKLIKMKI